MNEDTTYNKVLDAIKSSGLTYKEIARKAGIPYNTFLYMKDAGEFKSGAVSKILAALNKKIIIADDNINLKDKLKGEIGKVIDENL